MGTIDELIKDTGAYDCVECGKCTTVCPISNANPKFAPRLIVVKAMAGVEGLAQEPDIWTCTTCETCSDMCPYKVLYSEFIRGLRVEAVSLGVEPRCSQHGLMQNMMRMMTNPTLKQNRLKWVTPELKIADKGEVFYFTGCLPQMSIIFEDREGVNLLG
ncbi:MAG: (Fe-S)-binding protein, partial [Euryarchaeota archaeon]|nr:(Fe-S)-binding protein [Euryarchaeota archaeon]